MHPQIFFVFEVIYTIGLATIKTSIVFFYLRLFPNRRFRILLWGTLLFNILLGVSFTVVDFLQCRPLSFFWEGWDNEHSGICIDYTAMGFAHAGINIVLDMWMLILPATQVYSLKLPFGKKIQVLLMFSIGILYVSHVQPSIEPLGFPQVAYKI